MFYDRAPPSCSSVARRSPSPVASAMGAPAMTSVRRRCAAVAPAGAASAESGPSNRETMTPMRLLSVNVGQPREVDWRGREVRTSIWKSEVPRPPVGRPPQRGRRRAGRPDRPRRRAPRGLRLRRLRLPPLGARAGPRRLRPRPVRRELHRRGPRPTTRSASATATGSAARCSRSPSRGSRATRSGMRMGEPRMPALLYAHGRPGFYLRVLEEGEVGAGDAIERVAVGPGGDDRARGQRAALPAGPDRARARARPRHPRPVGGLAALVPGAARAARGRARAATAGSRRRAAGPPAWPGLRPFRIADGRPRDAARSRLRARARRRRAAAALPPGPVPHPARPARGRAAGAAAQLLAVGRARRAPLSPQHQARARGMVSAAPARPRQGGGDEIEVGAPRGLFTLDPEGGEEPVVLLSAGVGATPVLAMLESLAAVGGERRVWWIHGARNRAEHAFADEARRHVEALPGARSHVRYSRPSPIRRAGPRLRRRGPRDAGGAARPGRPARRGLLPLRPDGVDARPLRRPVDLGGRGRSASTPRSSAPSRSREPSAPRTHRRGSRAPAPRSPSPRQA